MGSGGIVDYAALDVEGEGVTKLGSLAPLEISTTNMLALGGRLSKTQRSATAYLMVKNLEPQSLRPTPK